MHKQDCDVKVFRPIAVTPALSKCMERLLTKGFLPTIHDNYQFAYRPKRSTENAVMLLVDKVSEDLDDTAENHVRGVFIDFKGAFNTINHKQAHRQKPAS